MSDSPRNIPVLDYGLPSSKEPSFGLLSLAMIPINIALQLLWPHSLKLPENTQIQARIFLWILLAGIGVVFARKARNRIGWNLFGFIVGLVLNLLMLACGVILLM